MQSTKQGGRIWRTSHPLALAGFLNIPSNRGTSRCLCNIQNRLDQIAFPHYGITALQQVFALPSRLFDLSELGKNVIGGPDAALNRIHGPHLQQIFMAKTVVLASSTSFR